MSKLLPLFALLMLVGISVYVHTEQIEARNKVEAYSCALLANRVEDIYLLAVQNVNNDRVFDSLCAELGGIYDSLAAIYHE